MSNLKNIEGTIDALKEVSSNALLKHGFSRSRQRIFDLSKTLDMAFQNHKIHVNKNAELDFVYFTICQSANGLKLTSIARRTAIRIKDLHIDILRDLIIQDKIIFNYETKLYKKK